MSIAEDMISGVYCITGCGEYLGEDSGYSRMCYGCQLEADEEPDETPVSPPRATLRPMPVKCLCPVCNKRLKTISGVLEHAATAHGKLLKLKFVDEDGNEFIAQ